MSLFDIERDLHENCRRALAFAVRADLGGAASGVELRDSATKKSEI